MTDGRVVTPSGDVYDWYVRGLELLAAGNPAAAAALLEHAHRAEPASRSIREALARAQYGSGAFRRALGDDGGEVQRARAARAGRAAG